MIACIYVLMYVCVCNVYMYVCMYVCIYVCMYVCIYVCMYVSITYQHTVLATHNNTSSVRRKTQRIQRRLHVIFKNGIASLLCNSINN